MRFIRDVSAEDLVAVTALAGDNAGIVWAWNPATRSEVDLTIPSKSSHSSPRRRHLHLEERPGLPRPSPGSSWGVRQSGEVAWSPGNYDSCRNCGTGGSAIGLLVLTSMSTGQSKPAFLYGELCSNVVTVQLGSRSSMIGDGIVTIITCACPATCASRSIAAILRLNTQAPKGSSARRKVGSACAWYRTCRLASSRRTSAEMIRSCGPPESTTTLPYQSHT
jgi:hypothetical protein